MAETALAYLTSADLASAPVETQGECLRGLARIESLHLVARSGAIRVFGASRGHEADGQHSPQAWLRWQTRTTRHASSAAAAWARQLAAHPAVQAALAAVEISVSWAQMIIRWSDRLPEAVRADADAMLLAAAAGGYGLAELSGLAEEIFRRCAPPDADDGKGFDDRSLCLDLTIGGAGRLVADLTPECAAAVQAVLDALGKKVGLEDERTQPQRYHDALEEACRRLAGSDMLPDRAGQSTQVQLHATLDQLLDQQSAAGAASTPGTSGAGYPNPPPASAPPASAPPASAASTEATRAWAAPAWAAAWAPDLPAAGPFPADARGWTVDPAITHTWMAARASADGQPGWIQDRTAAEAYSCDAQITPVVTGHVDKVAVALAVRTFMDATRSSASSTSGHSANGCRVEGCTAQRCPAGTGAPRPVPMSFDELMDLFLRQAIEVLSGPTGVAAHLRSASGGPAAYGVSLPLDVGAATATIPPHLRRAVITRDRHCAFPGCHQRPAACQVHHVLPRSQGGATALTNLVLLCSFHHLIAIHRWGWILALNGDGTTTVTSPDRQQTFHSHAPPGHGPPLATAS